MARPEDLSERGLPPAVDGLLRLSSALTQRLNQHLNDACGLSLAQYQFLWVAAAGPIALGDLASALGCTRGNVTGLADRLIDQGLLRRRQDPDDRRVTLVELTGAGAARQEAAAHAVRRALREVRGFWPLDAVTEAIGPAAAHPYPRRRRQRPDLLQERPAPEAPSRPGPERRPGPRPAAVRVSGERRPVIVVRDDPVVRLDGGGPLAE
ncbi:MAG TPA: MarR family winged helix-turn-helix transcriptional regulator [Bacillota bacterium]